MKQVKYVSNRTFLLKRDENDTPTRKRNLSLGAEPKTERDSPTLPGQDYQPVITYRRHRLQAKI